jgi:hypothetical protein
VVLAGLALLALVASGCSGDDDFGDGAARMTAGGTLEIAVDEGWSSAAVGDSIPDGARVRTGGAEARLELRHGQVWLAPQSMAVVTAELVDVIRGDLLVASGGTLAGRWGEVEAAGEAVFRLTPGVAPVVRVYSGESEIRRPGEQRTVSGLRQLHLAANRLPTRAVPLDYDITDPWDRALLPLAVAFDEEVARIARGIDRQHGTEPQDATFYESFAAIDASIIPILASSSRMTADGLFGPPSDALVTLFVSEAVADVERVALATAAHEVSRMRSAGARWGLLALEHDITTVELAKAVDLGQERRLTNVGAGLAPPSLPPDGSGAATGGSAVDSVVVGGGPTGTPAPAGTGSGGPAPAAPPPPPPEDPPPDDEPGGTVLSPLPPAPVPVPEPPDPAPQPPEPSLPLGDTAGAIGAVVDEVIDAAGDLLP